MGLGLDRRSVLVGAALLPLAACTTSAPEPPPPAPDPDEARRSAAADRERGLLERYDSVLAAVPSLAGRLQPLRDEHVEHLRALVGPEPSATGSPAPSAATAPPAPRDPVAALAGLLAAEAEAGAAHGSAALVAAPELAGLLASLAASEASHRVVLG